MRTATLDYLQVGQSVTDVFNYTVVDPLVATDDGTLTVTITGVNDAPRAVNDGATMREDAASVSGNVFANDSDVEGDALTAVLGYPSLNCEESRYMRPSHHGQRAIRVSGGGGGESGMQVMSGPEYGL